MSAHATYSIGKLARAANVTTRTIRYYVAQGLLPPPRGGGRVASYGDEHLNRLELIKLLKQEFLPLNEIKALLGRLDDDAVRLLLTERRQPAPTPAPDTAKEYLQALLKPSAKAPTLLRQAVAEKAQSPPAQLRAARETSRSYARRSPASMEAVKPEKEARPSRAVGMVWQRHLLHPDVELHIRQPPTDTKLGAHIDSLLADIRCLIAKHSA